MGRGALVFRQASPYVQFFHTLIAPWVHYIPVAANLHDVPSKLEWAKKHPRTAEAIAANGVRFAREHLHTKSIACYWWQLLRAFGELQDFEPRSSAALGFRPF